MGFLSKLFGGGSEKEVIETPKEPPMDKTAAVAKEKEVLQFAQSTATENGKLMVELMMNATDYFMESDRVPHHEEVSGGEVKE